MPRDNSTRQRLIEAAIALFQAQGITDTTTKQIAERAEVNEVTLFRQFGNKHGLLLAILQEATVVAQVGQMLIAQSRSGAQSGARSGAGLASQGIYPAVKNYGAAYLAALERSPDVVRSIVGEAGQYSEASRQALGAGLNQANQAVAAYFQTVIEQGGLNHYLSAESLVSLLNSLLLGYAVLNLTSEHGFWPDQEAFLEDVVTLFLRGAVSPLPGLELPGLEWKSADSDSVRFNPAIPDPINSSPKLIDIPATMVHAVLQRSRKTGTQDYAIAYVLFGAGLRVDQIVQLSHSDYLNDRDFQYLQMSDRQVPINQWILGKRYGSYAKNPLTQWLKSRKDQNPALFLGAENTALSASELQAHWQTWIADLALPGGQSPTLEQVPPTWCIEMLAKGMSLTDLQILTGESMAQLQAYAVRVREKAALEQAVRLDRNLG
jgi:AcrR family transcriptional regulator